MWKLLNGDRQPSPDYRFTIVAHLTSDVFLVHTVDSDSQCEGDLVCFQRDSVEAVPGCYGTGSSGWDYCYKPGTPPPTTTKSPTASPTLCPTDGPVLTAQPTGPITYKPGEATTLSEDGYVTLSTGLVAKLIAEAGKPVDQESLRGRPHRPPNGQRKLRQGA